MSEEIGNPFDAMRTAVQRAKMIDRAVNESALAMADLLRGRLRKLEGWPARDILRDLKRELRDFNITTGKWNDASL